MGKSKTSKKKKHNRKIAKQIDKWSAKHSWDLDEVLLAGFGALTAAADKGKKKRFTKLVDRGRRYANLDVALLADDLGEAHSHEASDPVISYSPRGGGWYSVQIDDVEVDRVQGEETAAERAGSLLESFAGLDPDPQGTRSTSLTHAGGGWYEVIVRGVPVARLRGKEQAHEQYGHLVSSDGN